MGWQLARLHNVHISRLIINSSLAKNAMLKYVPKKSFFCEWNTIKFLGVPTAYVRNFGLIVEVV